MAIQGGGTRPRSATLDGACGRHGRTTGTYPGGWGRHTGESRVKNGAATLYQLGQDLRRFWPLRVVFVRGGEEDRAIPIDHIRRWDRQFPTVVSVDEGKVDERAAVDTLLLFRDAVHQPELAGDIVVCIHQ